MRTSFFNRGVALILVSLLISQSAFSTPSLSLLNRSSLSTISSESLSVFSTQAIVAVLRTARERSLYPQGAPYISRLLQQGRRPQNKSRVPQVLLTLGRVVIPVALTIATLATDHKLGGATLAVTWLTSQMRLPRITERRPRGTILSVNALANGAKKSGEKVQVGTWRNLFREILNDSYYAAIYLVGVLPIGGLSERLNRQLHQAADAGADFYSDYTTDRRLRMVVYSPTTNAPNSSGSPFATRDPRNVNPQWGTLARIQQAVTMLRRKGKSLYVDVVTNHIGLDNPWINDHWEATVHIELSKILSPGELAALDDQDFFVGNRLVELGLRDRLVVALAAHNMVLDARHHHFFVFYRTPGDLQSRILVAHGRDPYYPGWIDTAQLDYTKAEARDYILGTLKFWAHRGAKVRADMVHLSLRLYFKALWYPSMPWEEFNERWPTEFWQQVLDEVVIPHPHFNLLLEAYGEKSVAYLRSLHPRLAVYSKHLYDLIESRNIHTIRDYLIGMPTDQFMRSVHSLQNHDDSLPWRGTAWDIRKKFSKAALLLMATIPGILMIDFRQRHGLERLPIQEPLASESSPDVPDNAMYDFHKDMLRLQNVFAVRAGDLTVVHSTNNQLLAYGRSSGTQNLLVVVNLTEIRQSGHVPLPAHWNIQRDQTYEFIDHYSPHRSSVSMHETVRASYTLRGVDILNHGGIYVDLDPGDAHCFFVFPVDTRVSRNKPSTLRRVSLPFRALWAPANLRHRKAAAIPSLRPYGFSPSRARPITENRRSRFLQQAA